MKKIHALLKGSLGLICIVASTLAGFYLYYFHAIIAFG